MYDDYVKNKEQLSKYLKTLDEKCKIFVGPFTSYQYPTKNPLRTYRNVADLEKTMPNGKADKSYLIKQKVCKFNTSNHADTDEKKRFYKGVKTQEHCKKLKGKWSPFETNRETKYDKGMCWTSDDNKQCGEQIHDDAMFRPYHAKYDQEFQKKLSSESDRCNKVPNCFFKQQTAYTYDCVYSTKGKEGVVGNAMIPPNDMPLYEFEKFLELWYSEKLVEQPPPYTIKLLGDGDRCNKKNEEVLVEQHENHDYLNLNPLKPNDAEILKEKLGNKSFTHLVTCWKNKDIKNVNIILSRLQYDEFEKDYTIANTTQKHAPSVPQSIINMVMKNISMKGGKNRGILAWHSVGSGKTNTATGVIDAFWDDKRRVIFASSIDALSSNPEWKFHELAQKYFPRFKEFSLETIKDMFKQRGIKFYSFAKLSNRVKKAQEFKKNNRKVSVPNTDEYIDLDNSIVIIDEVHNLFRPLATQRQQHEYLETHLIDPRKHPELKIVILTATPGDNIESVLKLLNMVRDSHSPVIKIPNINNMKELKEFKAQIRGLVSFFDMSYDTTKFPIVYDSEPIKCPMDKKQFQKYIEAYKTVSDIQKNFEKLSKSNQVYKYWAPARKYANTLFNFEKDMRLNDFSAKMPYLFDNLKKYKNEKHYVYTAFYTSHGYGGHGVISLAKELEKLGYQKLSVTDAISFNKRGIMPNVGQRYILAANTELGDDPKKSGDNLAEMLKIYNHPDNKRGEYVHVMLASQGFNEGIDLKAVRHIHFFEPLITMASDKQTIGRASRSCSHGDLDRNNGEWTVKIHRYMSDKPLMDIMVVNKSDVVNKIKEFETYKKDIVELKEKHREAKKIKNGRAGEYDRLIINHLGKLKDLTEEIKVLKRNESMNVPMIEEKIFNESRNRMQELLIIYKCMQEAAFDCRVLKEFHEKTRDERVHCEF